jgi:hypothetical protein
MEGACPTSDHHLEQKHKAYIQWFDWLARSARQFKNDRLSFRWDERPNRHVVARKNEQQR